MARKGLLLVSTLSYVLCWLTIDASGSGVKPKPRLFSLESNEGNVEISLDLSVPFITLPLEQKMSNHGEGGGLMSLLNINPKGLAIFGTLLVATAVVVPLFAKGIPESPTEPVPNFRPYQHHHHQHYAKEHKRSDRSLDIWHIDEILSRNGSFAPCVQRVVCTAVAKASHSGGQSSIDKIIDGLSSHKWIKQITNGTTIEEAISMGRKMTATEECSTAYKKCAFNQQILTNLLTIIGI